MGAQGGVPPPLAISYLPSQPPRAARRAPLGPPHRSPRSASLWGESGRYDDSDALKSIGPPTPPHVCVPPSCFYPTSLPSLSLWVPSLFLCLSLSLPSPPVVYGSLCLFRSVCLSPSVSVFSCLLFSVYLSLPGSSTSLFHLFSPSVSCSYSFPLCSPSPLSEA